MFRSSVAVLALAVSSVPVLADTTPDMDPAAELAALRARVAAIEAKRGEVWLNAERTEQIKGIVNEVLADAKHRGQFLDGDLQAGYKDGFFVQSGKDFKLRLNGYFQLRYTYAHSEVHDPEAFSSTPPHGDTNGVDFRRLRLYATGNIFDPNLIYCVSGDFAGSSTNNGTWQSLDNFVGYRFSDALAIKAGTFLVPFTHVEIAGPGTQFSEGPTVFFPFDPVRAIGVSAYGFVVPEKVTYEFNINNGQRSQIFRRVAAEGPTANYDNRLAYYTRWQWAGAGTIKEFADEMDLAWHKDFVWMLGGALGYESQNPTVTAFPAPANTLAVTGLSTANSPGFAPAQVVNADLYRATVDWHGKWQGWSTTLTGYFQQINSNAGPTDPFIRAYGSSLFEAAYFVQVGYFVIPQKLEIAGRFGQLVTDSHPNRMEEYSLGMNYYVVGHKFEIQTDVTYIPNEASYTDVNSATYINTQDIIYRLQLQLMF